jgi:hypothetical protein
VATPIATSRGAKFLKVRAYGIGDDVSPEVAEAMVALIEAGAHRGQWAQEVSRRRVAYCLGAGARA